MELQQIRYFITVAENLSFSKASARAYVSQQALSKSVNLLESELGVPLFNRHSYGLSLTPYGSAFIKNAYHIISIINQAENEIHDMEARSSSTVRLAFTAGLEDDFPTSELLHIQEKHPGFTLLSLTSNDKVIEEGLLTERFDIGIMGALGNSPHLEYIMLEKRSAVAIVNMKNPLSKKEVLRMDDLKGENFIFGGEQFYANNRLLASCNLAGFTPRITHQTISIPYVAELLRANQGIFVCPYKSDLMLSGCVAIQFENDPQVFGTYLAVKRGQSVSSATSILLNRLWELFPDADRSKSSFADHKNTT